MERSGTRGLLGVVLGLLLATGSWVSNSRAADDPLKIGVSLGLTGRFVVMSEALYKGFRLWETHVSQKGGIQGRPVQVIVKDDQGDPQRARRLYQALLAEDRVDFLFAPYSSLITESVLPIAEEHHVPILIAGAAADRLWQQGHRYAVGVYTPASQFTAGFLELLVWHGMERIAVIYADDSFSVDLANGSRTWAERFGLHVTLFKEFAKGTEDLEPLAVQARESGAQALLVCGHMNEAVRMCRALKRIHWTPLASYASVGPAHQAFYDQCGTDAEGVFGTSLWEPRADFPGARAFERDFVEAYGESPGYHAGLAYAAGQVLEEAIQEARTVDREKVRSALFQLDTMTIIGRFGVDSTGKQVRQQTFIIQWQNGRKELVWPDELRTSAPRFP